MNVDHGQQGQGSVIIGEVFPGVSEKANSANLYISLADLIAESIFYHPNIEACVDALSPQDKSALEAMLNGQSIAEHFVETLVNRITEKTNQTAYETIRICLSDFDSYEFTALLGGQQAEKAAVNPAMGLRGVSRYAAESYHAAFVLECQVIKALQETGLEIEIVVPFVRALSDAATIIDRLAENGLPRGIKHLKVSYCCDVPSSALLAERLLQYFDGIVINVDHLTQFTLGVDKYNDDLDYLYEPENEAVLALVESAIKSAHIAHKPAVLLVSDDEQAHKVQHYFSENTAADMVLAA